MALTLVVFDIYPCYLQVSEVCPFFLLSTILLYEYHSFFIHSSNDRWSPGLFLVLSYNVWNYYEHLSAYAFMDIKFLYFLGKYVAVGLLDYMVIVLTLIHVGYWLAFSLFCIL